MDALLTGQAQPASGRAAAIVVPAAERPMGVTTAPLLGLVLWLLGLLLVVLIATWLAQRWGALRTWVTALPVLLALSIGASGVAAQLLPNLL